MIPSLRLIASALFSHNANLKQDPRKAMVASKPLSIRQISQFDVNFIFFGKTYIRRKCDRRDRIQFHKLFPPSTLDESTPPCGGGMGWEAVTLQE